MSAHIRDDTTNVEREPQDTLRDQEQNMESEGQPVTAQLGPNRTSPVSERARDTFRKLARQAASERGA